MLQATLKHALEMGVGLPWRWGWDLSHTKHTAVTVERGDEIVKTITTSAMGRKNGKSKILLTELSN